MKTDESNPQHWFLLAAERMSAADVLYGQSGSTYTGIEILHEAVETVSQRVSHWQRVRSAQGMF